MNGTDLRLWRMGKGWSQERAGREMGFSRRTIARHELEYTDRDVPRHVKRLVELIDAQPAACNAGAVCEASEPE